MTHGIEMEILDTDPDEALAIAVVQNAQRGRVLLSVARFFGGYVVVTQGRPAAPVEAAPVDDGGN